MEPLLAVTVHIIYLMGFTVAGTCVHTAINSPSARHKGPGSLNWHQRVSWSVPSQVDTALSTWVHTWHYNTPPQACRVTTCDRILLAVLHVNRGHQFSRRSTSVVRETGYRCDLNVTRSCIGNARCEQGQRGTKW